MNQNKLIRKTSLLYEIGIFTIYCSICIFSYVYFHKDLNKTLTIIAAGTVINLIIFVISLKPLTAKIPKEERKNIDMNSSGIIMTQRIFCFFITVLNTIITIFFAALVIVTSNGKFI